MTQREEPRDLDRHMEDFRKRMNEHFAADEKKERNEMKLQEIALIVARWDDVPAPLRQRAGINPLDWRSLLCSRSFAPVRQYRCQDRAPPRVKLFCSSEM